jgi:signal transduction histidine kinase
MSTRSLGVVLAAGLAAVVISVVALGGRGALVTLLVLAGIGGLTFAAVHIAVAERARGRAGPLRRQFATAVVIVVGPLLVALFILSLLMFVSGHDAAIVAVVVAFAGVVGIVAGQRLSVPIIDDARAIRDGLVAVGNGERELTIATTGRDELAELATAAGAMVERLAAEEAARDQSEAARRHLVAAVSHDLRTPITSLRLLSDAVEDEIVGGAGRVEYLARMRTHLIALSALIDDLFELSRLEAGDITWSLGHVPLDELVQETVAAMRVHAERKGVAIRADLPASLRPARANPEKLQRVLFNLVQNAIRHTPADGSVVIRARPLEDRIEVEVADTGNGVASEERELIFDPFYRGGADASRTTDGAGLGLAVSRAIVEAHGGRIWLADSAIGTRVRFSVPLAA